MELSRLKQKKGIELNQAFGAVLTIVLVAVLVIIAIVIFVELSSGFGGTITVLTINETLTSVDELGERVSGTQNCSFGDLSVTRVMNSSSGTVIPAANYTITSATGLIVWNAGTGEDSQGFNNSDWLAIYSYTWGSEACDASLDMVTEFDNYTSLIGLVGTIIFLGLVIGVLVAAFAFGGKREV